MLLLKIFDSLADQINHFSIGRSAFILRNIMQLVVWAKKNAEILGLMVNEPHVAPEELAAVRAQTLVIAGTKDMIRDDHTRLIVGSIPEAKLVILPGDHFIAAKEPETFNRAVLDFLQN